MSEEKENKKQSEELSKEELEKVTGGDGVPGESTDDKHKDWIEIASFNHNIS